MVLFFFLVKAAQASLPIAPFVTLRPPFLLREARFVHVFPLKLVSFCKLSVGLDSTNESAISLLSDSRSVLFSVFPFTANSLAHPANIQVTMDVQTLLSREEQRG